MEGQNLYERIMNGRKKAVVNDERVDEVHLTDESLTEMLNDDNFIQIGDSVSSTDDVEFNESVGTLLSYTVRKSDVDEVVTKNGNSYRI